MSELSQPAAIGSGFRMTLRRKTVAVTCGSALLVAVILTLAFFVQMRTVMSDELRARARTVAIGLATNLAFATFSGDAVGLQTAADGTLREIPDAAYVIFRGARDEMLVQAGGPGLGAAELKTVSIPLLTEKDRAVDQALDVAGQALIGASAMIVIEQKQGAAAADLGLGLEPAPEPAAGAGKRSVVGMVQVGFHQRSLESKISAVTTRALGLGVAVILACAVVAFLLARLLTVPLERLTAAASAIAKGDLSQRVETGTSRDEIGQLASSFGTMSSGLRRVVFDLQAAAADLQREASIILSTASQQAAMASEQASAINETSSTAMEIAQTSQQATNYADSVIKITERSNELSLEGQKVVEQSVQAIEKLGEQVSAIAHSITDLLERSVQIGDIIATVKDVAEQSNLLALNASIEAAKAGEHGRGFAVVAMEMRNLAEQSKLAAGQVRAILSEVQKGTRAAVEATEEGSRRASAAIALAESAGKAIEGLTDASRESSLAARQIANNTRQQTLGVEQIVTAITDQSRAMNEAVAGTRQIEQVAGNLSGLSRRMDELVSRYNARDGGPAPRASEPPAPSPSAPRLPSAR